MAPRSDANQISLLLLINKHKSILFGKLTPTITKEVKKLYWNIVLEAAIKLNIVSENRNSEYVRDTTWANWKKRFTKKFDKRNSTGEEGGYELMNTEADEIMYQILGKDSPIIKGLNVRENMDERSTDSAKATSQSTTQIISADATKKTFATAHAYNSQGCKGKKHKTTEMDDLSTKKLKLTIELMELDRRTKIINVYNLEKQNGISHCELTQELEKEFYACVETAQNKPLDDMQTVLENSNDKLSQLSIQLSFT